MSSSLAKKCLEKVGSLGFCEKIQQVKYHAKLTSLFTTNLRRDKVTIEGVSFTISNEAIATTSWILNNGEWFKSLYLDVQNYKPFIKGLYKDVIKKVFPFGQLLDKFSPLMRAIMKYFTCEGRFYR